MLKLEKVTKQFGAQRAIDNLDLDIAPNKTTVLIGPSGCGKSTILRLLIGLLKPDQGAVLIDKRPISEANLSLVRRRIGYVIQDGGLFPHLTAEDNICLMARHIGWDEQKISARLHDLGDLSDFPMDGMDRYPMQLSGGQQQRVALMRALMLDPDILLMDEPLGALDPLIRTSLQDDLREIFLRLRKTVVLVTHDMNEAAFFGDAIVLMRDGVIVQQGPLEALLNHPSEPFVDDFISAQRSHLPGAQSA